MSDSTLPEDRGKWPAEALEEWAERAAVLEYDARMSRERAERAAEHIVRERWQRTRSPMR